MIIDATAELTDESRKPIPSKYYMSREQRDTRHHWLNNEPEDDTFEFPQLEYDVQFSNDRGETRTFLSGELTDQVYGGEAPDSYLTQVRSLFGVMKKRPSGLISICFVLAGNSQSYGKNVYLGAFEPTEGPHRIDLSRYFIDDEIASHHLMGDSWREYEPRVRKVLQEAKRMRRVFDRPTVSLELIAHDLADVLPVND
jgi:hypothetical protein